MQGPLRLLLCSLVAWCPTSSGLPHLHSHSTFNGVTVYCWHFHIYFLERNEASTSNALALRTDFIAQFFERISPELAAFQPCAAEVN
jgi:hypothetical protein